MTSQAECNSLPDQMCDSPERRALIIGVDSDTLDPFVARRKLVRVLLNDSMAACREANDRRYNNGTSVEVNGTEQVQFLHDQIFGTGEISQEK